MPLSPDSKMLAENCGKVRIYRHLWHIGGIKDMPQISIGKVSMTRLFVIPALGLIVLIGSVGVPKQTVSRRCTWCLMTLATALNSSVL